MRHVHAVLLVMLVFVAAPTRGEETDHSQADHSQMNHAATDGTAKKPISAHAAADNAIHSYFLFDQLEIRDSHPDTGFGWDLEGWIGTDLTRLWLRSEGEIASSRTEAAEMEVLVGRSISPWWDIVAGLRHDFRPEDSRTFGAIGVQGLAPQWFELDATLYLGDAGQSAARFTAQYELLFTNRLVLQPRVELNLHGKTEASRNIGSGLSNMEAGLRLRYEFTRQFAPYVGLEWTKAFGKTATLLKGSSGGTSDAHVVGGVRLWF
jgi:copper resistance protein B